MSSWYPGCQGWGQPQAPSLQTHHQQQSQYVVQNNLEPAPAAFYQQQQQQPPRTFEAAPAAAASSFVNPFPPFVASATRGGRGGQSNNHNRGRSGGGGGRGSQQQQQQQLYYDPAPSHNPVSRLDDDDDENAYVMQEEELEALRQKVRQRRAATMQARQRQEQEAGNSRAVPTVSLALPLPRSAAAVCPTGALAVTDGNSNTEERNEEKEEEKRREEKRLEKQRRKQQQRDAERARVEEERRSQEDLAKKREEWRKQDEQRRAEKARNAQFAAQRRDVESAEHSMRAETLKIGRTAFNDIFNRFSLSTEQLVAKQQRESAAPAAAAAAAMSLQLVARLLQEGLTEADIARDKWLLLAPLMSAELVDAAFVRDERKLSISQRRCLGQHGKLELLMVTPSTPKSCELFCLMMARVPTGDGASIHDKKRQDEAAARLNALLRIVAVCTTPQAFHAWCAAFISVAHFFPQSVDTKASCSALFVFQRLATTTDLSSWWFRVANLLIFFSSCACTVQMRDALVALSPYVTTARTCAEWTDTIFYMLLQADPPKQRLLINSAVREALLSMRKYATRSYAKFKWNLAIHSVNNAIDDDDWLKNAEEFQLDFAAEDEEEEDQESEAAEEVDQDEKEQNEDGGGGGEEEEWVTDSDEEYGEDSGYKGDSDDDDDDDDDDDEYRSMYGFDGGCNGLTASECDELMMQGVKPWDDDGDADAVLAALGIRSRRSRLLEAAAFGARRRHKVKNRKYG